MTDDARDKDVLEAAHKIIAVTESYDDYARVADALRVILSDRARLTERCERQARVVETASKVMKGIDEWNEEMQKIIGRQVNYKWGGLEELRAALAAARRPAPALTEQEIEECIAVAAAIRGMSREYMGIAIRAALRKADEIRAGGES